MTSHGTSELNKITENNPGKKKKKLMGSFYTIDKALKKPFLKKISCFYLGHKINTEQPGFDPKAKLHSFHIKISIID